MRAVSKDSRCYKLLQDVIRFKKPLLKLSRKTDTILKKMDRYVHAERTTVGNIPTENGLPGFCARSLQYCQKCYLYTFF